MTVADGEPQDHISAPPLVPAPFRRDIQGLRAVAVLLVVVFHTGLAVDGGFVGVDVFFVVSGFVIAGQLLRQLDASGRIGLGRFYERRVKRLLPASSIAAIATLAATTLILSPLKEQQFAAATARAASVFAANLYLYRSGGGYFDAAEEHNPFLHTWTLSVEEQFYVLLPLLLVAGAFLARKLRRPPAAVAIVVVGLTALLSFTLGVLALDDTGRLSDIVPSMSRLAFYGPATRAWEFAAGVGLAFASDRWGRRTSSAMRVGAATVGAVAIAVAAVGFDARTPFPGVAALLPVVGGAAVIWAGSGGPSPVRALLEWRPVVWLGDRSYGWYLWHWPAIVVARVAWPESGPALGLAAALSLAPAAASYRWIEQPIRRHPRLTGWRVAAMAGVCIAVPVVLATIVLAGADRRWGLDVPDGWKDRRLAVVEQCEAGADRMTWPSDRCRFGPDDATATVLLLGDSHAASASDGVVAAATDLGFATDIWFNSGCPFLVGRAPTDDLNCPIWQERALDLAATNRPDLVIISNRSAGYTLPTVPRNDRWLTIGDADGDAPDDQEAAIAEWSVGLDGALGALDRLGIPVLVLDVVPEFSADFASQLSLVRPDPGRPVVDMATVDARRGPVLDAEAAVISRHPDASSFDPAPFLCAADGCRALVDGDWRYMDRTHLTPIGSRLLAEGLSAAIERATA